MSASAADYYVAVPSIVAADPSAVVERGRQAGGDLGPDPCAAVEALVTRVVSLAARDDDPVIWTLAGGMRPSAYLPTRIVELVVHGQDIARALELPRPDAAAGPDRPGRAA